MCAYAWPKRWQRLWGSSQRGYTGAGREPAYIGPRPPAGSGSRHSPAPRGHSVWDPETSPTTCRAGAGRWVARFSSRQHSDTRLERPRGHDDISDPPYSQCSKAFRSEEGALSTATVGPRKGLL